MRSGFVGAKVASMNARIQLSLEIEPSEPVSGSLITTDGEVRRFGGWLEMHSALEALCAAARERTGGGAPPDDTKREATL